MAVTLVRSARAPARSGADAAAALRHEQLAVRTIAVTFRAARRATNGPVPLPEEGRRQVEHWRRWALDALDRHAATIRDLRVDGPLRSALRAVEAELEAARASVTGGGGT